MQRATTSSTARATTTTTLAPTTSTTAPTTTTTVSLLSTIPTALAPDPETMTGQVVAMERILRDPAVTDPAVLAAAAKIQQLGYRALALHPEWEPGVLALVPPDLQSTVWHQMAARREFRSMAVTLATTLPAWRIIPPAPQTDLLAYYQEAQATFGVPWQYLAAINLVETGIGRIDGVSSAGAQGPMQFMPETWASFGAGGDVHNPRDAILGAARYLAHNGMAAGNVEGALWNYNHDSRYVRGVQHYAQIMIENPQAFTGLYYWEIYYLTAYGDVHLPVGYYSAERIPVPDYLAAHPQS